MNYALKLSLAIPLAIHLKQIDRQNWQKYQIKRPLIAPYNKNESFIVSAPEQFREKLRQLKSDGLLELQITADFDHTLTRSKVENRSLMQTFPTMQQSRFVSERARQKFKEIYNIYRKIEVDEKIPLEEKVGYIKEWYLKDQEVLNEEHILKEQIPQMIEESTLLLRYGINEILHFCQENDVNFYIVSAGVGDFIQIIMDSIFTTKDTKIFANWILFDEKTQVLQRYIDPIITPPGKSKILDQSKFDYKFKKNVIVLGDIIEVSYLLSGCLYGVKNELRDETKYRILQF